MAATANEIPLRFSTIVPNASSLVENSPSLSLKDGRNCLTQSQVVKAQMYLGSLEEIRGIIEKLVQNALASTDVSENKEAEQRLSKLLELSTVLDQAHQTYRQSFESAPSPKPLPAAAAKGKAQTESCEKKERIPAVKKETLADGNPIRALTCSVVLDIDEMLNSSEDEETSDESDAEDKKEKEEKIPLKAKKEDGVQDFFCSICTFDCPGNEKRVLSACDHEFCADCLKSYLTIKIKEGLVTDEDMVCPSYDCKKPLDDFVIQFMVDEEVWQKYLQFSMFAYLESDKNTRYCPKKSCGYAMIGQPGVPLECPECKTRFCFDCSQTPHPGKTCEEARKENEASGKVDLDEKEFKKWRADTDTRDCPSCGIVIERNAGCNHFTCTKCKYQFCWLCGQEYNDLHYTKGACRMKQFTLPDGTPDPNQTFFDPTIGAFVDVATGQRLNTNQVLRRTEPRRRRVRRKAKKVGKYALIGTGVAVAAPVALTVVVAGAVITTPFWVPYAIYRAAK